MDSNNIITLIIALIAAVPPTLMAYAALVKSRETAVKSDVIIEKANEIHTLTNSNLSKVSTSLEVANKEIAGLKDMVTSLKVSE